MIKAALFDLDGVVFDTESQYSVFWGMIGREYHPEMPDFALRIKGQTLVQIYDKYFSDDATFAHIDGYTDCKSEQAKITARLDEFELNMSFPYIPGFETFLKDVKAQGVKCAVVTSSNLQKMEQVYKHHPERRFCQKQAGSRLLSQGCCLFRSKAGGMRRSGGQLQRAEGSESFGCIYPRTRYYQFGREHPAIQRLCDSRLQWIRIR